MGAQFLSQYLIILDIKIIFSLARNLKKILNLTSDSIIIQTLICSFVMFFIIFSIKRLINGIHKTFLKHSIFVPIIFKLLPNISYQTFAKPKNVALVLTRCLNLDQQKKVALFNSR